MVPDFVKSETPLGCLRSFKPCLVTSNISGLSFGTYTLVSLARLRRPCRALPPPVDLTYLRARVAARLPLMLRRLVLHHSLMRLLMYNRAIRAVPPMPRGTLFSRPDVLIRIVALVLVWVRGDKYRTRVADEMIFTYALVQVGGVDG